MAVLLDMAQSKTAHWVRSLVDRTAASSVMRHYATISSEGSYKCYTTCTHEHSVGACLCLLSDRNSRVS